MASTFALTIRDGMETEIIEWPIVRSTAKAVLVATPGGELWLPLWRFQKRGYRADEAGQIIALLADVSATASDARVRVWRAGAGPSGKSHKFQIAVRRQSSDSHGQPTTEVRRRCFTLPLSQIKGSRGNWSAPAWLLKKRLANGETLARGDWAGLEAVASQVKQMADRVSSARRAAEESARLKREAEARKKAVQEAAEAAELERLTQAIEEDGELGLAFCRRKFTLSEMEDAGIHLLGCGWPTWPPKPDRYDLRLAEKILLFARAQPKFESWKARNAGKELSPKSAPKKARVPDQVLENVRVQWVDWGGTSKNRVRIENDQTGCTVKFFGSKREITTPDGTVLIKMAGSNLLIHVAENEYL